ncbi:integral membrane protein (TIGR01906 family) [Herbinix hemicellulosilytica]|uniref:Putative membrane protein n=1 Tax=Herbinix hemicellulosilytica TaxID=1564487 RepID=A0A0H5SJW4_HERHM|nr:TIGR01906 family membrane protein [Herbinix hemicellulosilytica]RBP58474.1 integral membrane protein (TIGR01906 family) [Herbinix hemicellulosilytica]CRZ35061.1 putative membrane protein [Herbinix hemicellulosilytica]
MLRLRRFKKTDLLIGVVFFLLLLSVGVVFTVNFRPLYYLDVKLLKIPETSGYPKEEIIANYNALIDYSSPFYRGSLSFPTLDASPSGIQHFKEVKDIFTLFYILAAITLIAAVIIIIYKSRKRDFSYLAVSSLVSCLLPVIIALLLAIDFDTAFIIFHKIFFNNDYWIFDPITDPVINILPATFFLHCALLIIFIILLGSLIMYIIYLCLKRRSGIKYRKIRGLKL